MRKGFRAKILFCGFHSLKIPVSAAVVGAVFRLSGGEIFLFGKLFFQRFMRKGFRVKILFCGFHSLKIPVRTAVVGAVFRLFGREPVGHKLFRQPFMGKGAGIKIVFCLSYRVQRRKFFPVTQVSDYFRKIQMIFVVRLSLVLYADTLLRSVLKMQHQGHYVIFIYVAGVVMHRVFRRISPVDIDFCAEYTVSADFFRPFGFFQIRFHEYRAENYRDNYGDDDKNPHIFPLRPYFIRYRGVCQIKSLQIRKKSVLYTYKVQGGLK